jgi:hypothetical protein
MTESQKEQPATSRALGLGHSPFGFVISVMLDITSQAN